MTEDISVFERITRAAPRFDQSRTLPSGGLHPFEERNISSKLPPIVRGLFDDGHYSQATFEAYKFIDNEVQRISRSNESGFKLMMKAFADSSPLVAINSLSNQTDTDEQKGFQFLFAGAVLAIRNPRGHTHSLIDSPDRCLDHLSFASMLLRRLESAGYK